MIDLVDESFVVVDRAVLAGLVADPALWPVWWPHLRLTVFMDRGLDGVRWSVTGDWVGSMEVWLEPVGDGVLVHHYARLDPAGEARSDDAGLRAARHAARARDRHAQAWKRVVWSWSDGWDAQRAPGEPRRIR
jgi:hypothetical protein